LIRSSEENDLVKLELAIIENLQREDLNAVDRARAFQKLADEFHFKHIQIAQKVGKSREYVSNSLRILSLPEEILNALSEGKISEGHTRPILMLTDRPEEQLTLFKEIMFKKLTVREAEAIARRVAYDRVRKKELAVDPEIVELEEKLAESFGTRVKIERKETGGKILIDFFSNEDLREILQLIEKKDVKKKPTSSLERHISQILAKREDKKELPVVTVTDVVAETVTSDDLPATAPVQTLTETKPDIDLPQIVPEQEITVAPDETVAMVLDDRTKEEITKHQEEEEDLYSIKNFSL
jgi:hypothetical protein